MAVDVEGQTPSLASIWGGLSSPVIRPVVLYMVHRGGRAVQIPVIGIGGISSMDQIVRLVKTGPGAHRAQLPHVN